MEWWEMIIALGIPSGVIGGIVGIWIWWLQRKIQQNANAQAERDAKRHQFEINQYKLVLATCCLTEANAIAIQNGKCNGETHAALERVRREKQSQRDFIASQGIEHLF